MVTHRHPNDQIVIVEMQNQAGGLLSESSPGLLFESAEDEGVEMRFPRT
jgi:hypothetical protein